MKKITAVCLSYLMLLLFLAGCGSQSISSLVSSGVESVSSSAAYDDYDYYYDDYYYDDYYEEAVYEVADYDAPMSAAGDYYGGGSVNTLSASAKSSGTESAAQNDIKMIYTAYVEMESTSFDDAVDGLAALTESCGGYYESSSLSDRGSSRSASFSVRVPADQYRTFLQSAGALCHVTYQEESSEDVSETYYDTAGRLATQQTKLERLRELLAEASHMDDIIILENEISDTEEMIDRLSGTLRHYDALVSYSTVNITLREVKNLTEIPEVTETFGSRLRAAFRGGLQSIAEVLKDLAVALAYSWLWIVLIAAVVVIVLLATKKKRAERRERKKNAPTVTVPGYSQPETAETKDGS